MKSKIVKIGNSQGIRIPKPIIEQVGIEQDIEIIVEDNRLVISPAQRPRSDWLAAFQKMAERGDDKLLDLGEISPKKWDEEEWEWK
ncbi:MAG: AbrB/MazE/SpoVT family DNA-binding domain-containing protein [Candidatus Krumholzibacteriota bacterium]|nr:AbrB/MazE/SpoVT family DNA-binding domain-containing protein [Candidatus Krumholzibacteriota bacterium]